MTTEEFKDKLDKANLSKKQFSDITGISYGTIGNWHDENRPVPSWVDSWLDNYISKKKYDYIKNIIKDELRKE